MRVLLILCMAGSLFVAPQVSAQQQEQVKDPWVSFLLSAVVVGGGQVYNDQVGKGVVQFTGAAFGLGLALQSTDPLPGAALFLGCHLWSLIDAPMTANRINREARQSALYINPVIREDLVGASLTYRF